MMDQSSKAAGVLHGHICQHFSINFTSSLFQAKDQLAVRYSINLCSSVYTHDP